jgi:uncharacterized phiE125 gp8 family phage protein
MGSALRLLTPPDPAIDVVSVETAKTCVRSFDSVDDALISTWIRAARSRLESVLRRSFLTQTWELSFNGRPPSTFELPNPPLRQILSVKAFDRYGTEHLIDPASYVVDPASEPALVHLTSDVGWGLELRRLRTVVCEYEAGYGSPSEVPPEVAAAVLKTVATLYLHREDDNDGVGARVVPVPLEALRLVGHLKVWRV